MSQFLRSFMGSGIRPWLRKDGSRRLFNLHLTQVENPLDPDPLWENRYGGGSDITEVISGSRTRRLKSALDAHRKLIPEWDEFGFPIEKMQVFSDVVIWVPAKLWNNSSREGGEQLFLMAEKLKYRHRNDFEAELYKGKEPIYAIMPLESLGQNEVICQFGLGVYLPSETDQRVAKVNIIQEGQQPIQLGNWIFFDNNGKEIERPCALYTEQHFLLLGHTLYESAILSPYWIDTHVDEEADNTGYIMVDTHRQPERAYGDDDIIKAGNINKIGQNIYCDFYAVNDTTNSLQLHLQTHTPSHDSHVHDTINTPLRAGETIIDVEENNIAEPVNELSGLTVIGDEVAPDFLFHVTITAIVLPRIAIRGIKYWLLHLNAKGMPAEADETIVYQLRGGLNDTLEWRECTEKIWQSLDSPLDDQAELPFLKAHDLTLRQSVLHEKYYAILPLTQALSYPVSAQEILIGRGERKGNNAVDFALTLLNQKDSIQWSRITRRKQTLGHLGTSAQHVRVSIKGHTLQLQQLSQSAPTYILRSPNTISETLAAKSQAQTTIELEQEIIIGNYLLQFQQDYIRDDKA